jgi:signal transduction histidine kinase/DNA-binding beta-propeller fold protein YncE
MSRLRHTIRNVNVYWWNARYFCVSKWGIDPQPHLQSAGWASLAFILFLSIAVSSFTPKSLADNTGQYAASDVIGEFNAAGGSSYPAPTNQYGMGPSDVITDPANHRLFVDDGSNSRILVYLLNNSNQLVSNVPDYVFGQPDLTTNPLSESGSEPTTASSIQNSIGMAYDPTSQTLFVTDASEDRVLVFNMSGTLSNNMAASYELGEPNFTTNANTNLCNTGTVSSTTLRDPMALAYDATNKYLFVADGCDNRVLMFDLSSGITNGMAASHVLGEANFTTSTGGATQALMKNATGLAYDATDQYLFVSDSAINQIPSYGNNRILVYSISGGIADGMNASYVLGQTNFTNNTNALTASGLNSPGGLDYVASTKQLFVADTSNSRILDFNLTSGIVDGMNASNVIGEPNFTTNNSFPIPAITRSSLSQPQGVSYDLSTKLLYVTDGTNTRVMVFDLSSGITNGMNASNELGQTDFNGNPTYTSGTFNDYGHFLNQFVSYPFGTAIDPAHHRLFVSDSGNNRVLVYGLDANDNLTNHVAVNVLGEPDFTTTTSQTAQQNTIVCPGNVAYDGGRNYLFAIDTCSHRILVYDLSSGITNFMNATYVIGQTSFTANGSGLSQSSFGNLNGGLVYDPTTKYLYVDDATNNRVMVFNTSSLSSGMNASYVLGQLLYTTSTAAVSQSGVDDPSALAVDPQHQLLFVADGSGAGRVSVFNIGSISNDMNASYVLGETGFTSSNSPADTGGTPDAKSFTPYGLAYDTVNQRLFVEDNFGNRVLSFDLAGGITNDMAASAEIGEPNFTTSTSPLTINKYNFLYPTGGSEAYDTTNNHLYVTDGSNSRVLMYYIANLADINDTPNVGDVYNQNLVSQTQGTATYSMVSGTLPTGLSFNTSTGNLSGTVTTAGTYTFTLAVSDNNGPDGIFATAKQYSVTVGTGGSNNGGGGGGNNNGGSGGGNNSGGGSQPGPGGSSGGSSPPQTTVTTPDGLVVNINLENGQTIPLSSYNVTFTPEPNKDVSLKQVAVYENGQLVYTALPDQSGNARWNWQPSSSGPADLKFVVTDSIGRQSTQLVSVTVNSKSSSPTPVIITPAADNTVRKSNILDDLTRFVGSLPNVVVQHIPYVLFLLLFVDVVLLARRVLRELHEWRVQQTLLKQAKNVNLLKTTFVQLTSHYLRTPITIIKGGAEMLAPDAASAEVTSKLKNAADELGKNIESLVEQAQANDKDPVAMFVGSNSPERNILFQPIVFVPIVLIGVVCLIFDYLVRRAGTFSLGTVALIEQAAAFSICVLLLYSTYRYWRLKRRDNHELKNILESELTLGTKRDNLITEASIQLADKLDYFDNLLEKIPKPDAKKFITKGTKQLDDVVSRFQIAKLLQGVRSDTIATSETLGMLLKPLEAALQDELSKQGMSLQFNESDTVPVPDTKLITYVLQGIIQNAIAYKREPGKIVIATKANSMTISDQGIGIPENRLSMLFQPFFKAEGAETFSHEGMGFSLHLDKLILTYLGGDITVASTENVGTTVTLTLRS